jgi:diketogulonate reductase-like aldo/keto reductase
MEEHKTDNAALIATTVANSPLSLKFGASAIAKSAEASCGRLGTSGVELLQVQRTWLYPGLVDGLARAVDMGYCNSVGACNLGKGGIQSLCRKLERRGLTLTSNQVRRKNKAR